VTDVLIVGGGPAGASLAILLARAGLRVELLDRARFPRDKVCGEGLMPAGVAALARCGVAAAGHPFRGVRYHCGGVSVAGPFPDHGGTPALGLGVRRYHLDHALWQAAAATPGVQAFAGVDVREVIIEAGRAAGVRTTAGDRPATLIVAADGVHSRIRKQLGLDRPARQSRAGLRRHFQLAAGQTPPEWVDVYLGHGSEVYVTPVGPSEVQVALLSSHGIRKDQYARIVTSHPRLASLLDGAAPSSELAGMHPLSGSARQGFAPGCVLVGDAAGFIDPVTGGGITQALTSSELLAHTLAANFPPSPATLEAFERKRHYLLADYRRLTSLVLGMAGRPFLTASMVRLMRLWPALFSHAIGVSGGIRRLLPGLPA
jgi:menaquinone-9 beta-reductase